MEVQIISFRNQQYKLVFDVPGLSAREKPVLAVLDNYEGTGCWSLCDIRRHQHHLSVGPYFGNSADDFNAYYKANTPQEVELLRRSLKEFQEEPQDDGSIEFSWCTYRGIVRGRTAKEINEFTFFASKYPVMHKRGEGLALVNEMVDFWRQWMIGKSDEEILSQAGCVKINNPFIQPTESELRGQLAVARAIALVQKSGDPLVVALSQAESPKAKAAIQLYHGTWATFDAFDMAKAKDGAHFFTDNQQHAASFGAARAYLVDIQNPMEIGQDDLEAEWDKAHPDGEQDERYLLPRDFVGVFVQRAKDAGHDALIVRQMGDREIQADMYLPFKPDQIQPAQDEEVYLSPHCDRPRPK